MDNSKKQTMEKHFVHHHKPIYWVIFLVILGLFVVLIFEDINNWKAENDQTTLTVTVPKILTSVISLDPQTKTVSLGDTFAANIVLDTGGGQIDGVDIYALHYDPTILSVIDDLPNQKGTQIQPGNVFPYNAANIVDSSTGTIKFSQVAAGGTTYTGKGTVATIHFKAIGAGTTYLKFDFNKGSTVQTNAAHRGKNDLTNVVDAIYSVTKP
jgi:hypothetical protein